MRATGCAAPPKGFAPHARRPLRAPASRGGRPHLARAVRGPSAFVAEAFEAEDVFDGDVSVAARDAPDAEAGAVSFSAFCASALEMTDADVAKVLDRVPKLKGYDVDRVLAPKVDLLARELGAGARALRASVMRDPRLLTVSLRRLRATARWVETECGVGADAVGAVLCKQPSLAWLSVEHNLGPALAFLRDEIGMPPESLAATAAKHPSVLAMSTANLESKRSFFASEPLFLGAETANGMLRKNPQLFALSLTDSVAPKLAFFANELGLGEDGAARLVAKSPATLFLSLERNIRPTFTFLERELELGKARAAKLVLSRPTLLAYSIDNKLRPTVAYLTHSFFPTCDAYDAAMLCTYSLRGRIAPRARALREKGLMATASADPAFAPTTAMCASDARFCEMVGMERERYDALVREAKGDPDAGRLGWLRDGRRADESHETDEAEEDRRAYDENDFSNDASVVADSDSDSSESASDENAKVAKVSLTSEEWTLEAAREMAARALREGEGGTRR